MSTVYHKGYNSVVYTYWGEGRQPQALFSEPCARAGGGPQHALYPTYFANLYPIHFATETGVQCWGAA